MKRPVFKGTISFGLVSLPIELYRAVEAHAISFKNLHSACNTPLETIRWCPTCEKEVAWEDVVKGYKQEDGSYIILTKEALKDLKPESTNAITIKEFIEAGSVAPLYYHSHYYVAPQREGNAAFHLFLSALTSSNYAALGQFVLRDRDAVCLIQPYEDTLLLSTLHYAYEIIAPKALEKGPSLNKKELELAQLLMKKMYKKTFDIRDFKDTFAQRLSAALKKEKKQPVKKPSKKAPSSLMEALAESLGQRR